MTVPERINLVTLGVADVERAADFYEALGWKRSPASVAGEVAFFATGGSAMALYGYEALARDSGIDPAGPDAYRGFSCSINVSSDDAVDSLIAAAEKAGANVTSAGHRAPWGGYIGYFTDPDGNLWEAAHNPGFVLDDNGLITLP